MQFQQWLCENELIGRSTLYHGTAGDFDSFDLSFAGERDYGDYGIGVYLSPSATLARMYAYNASKRRSQPPLILKVEHHLQRTANFDDPEFQKQVAAETGAPFPKKLSAGGKQTRPKEESEAITRYLVSQGYDSATAYGGKEIVAYDPSKLQIVDKADPERASYWV
jgi:hypothetical protein